MTKNLLNFHHISVLNCFSKVYDNMQKTQIVEKRTIYFPLLSLLIENRTTRSIYLLDLLKNGEKTQTVNTLLGLFLCTFQRLLVVSPMIWQLRHQVLIDLVIHSFTQYYSNLKSRRKQCVSVNNIKSTFKEILSGVPQGTLVGSILFNIFFNESFYFILVASAHNFADDNTRSSFAKTIENLISILESERNIAVNQFKDNHKQQEIDQKEIKVV